MYYGLIVWINMNHTSYSPLDWDADEEEVEVALDLDDGVEGYGSPREVLEQVDRVLDDAYAVEVEVGVDVRDGARADAAAAGGDGAERRAAVADGDVEAAVVEREEVRVADADLERGGDVEGNGGPRDDGDVRETEARDADIGVGWPEEEPQGEEREGGEEGSEPVAAAAAAQAAEPHGDEVDVGFRAGADRRVVVEVRRRGGGGEQRLPRRRAGLRLRHGRVVGGPLPSGAYAS